MRDTEQASGTTTRAVRDGGADVRSDVRSDSERLGDVRDWARRSGFQWTTDPIEAATADAVYCPVGAAHERNPTLEALHQEQPALRRHWRSTVHRPGTATSRTAVRTRVLALLDEHTPKRWILYADESGGPGSGIRHALAFARRSGFKTLAVGPGTDPRLAEPEARSAIQEAAADCPTRVNIHSGPVRLTERAADGSVR